MFGDCLRANLGLLRDSDPNARRGDNAFWVILLKSAVQDIISIYPSEIYSANAIETYYDILKNNEEYVPNELKQILESDHQERYRVIIRNVFSSNADHRGGLQNQKEIIWREEPRQNYNRRPTNSIIYRANPKYVITELLKEKPDVIIDVSESENNEDDGTAVTLATGETYRLIKNQLPRDISIRNAAIERANRTCELCGTTQTFATNDGNQYFEGHHLIMLNPTIQERYDNSLDNVENIFCLCPECHKKVHYADNSTRSLIVRTLLSKHPNLKNIYEIYTEEDIQAIINDYLRQD